MTSLHQIVQQIDDAMDELRDYTVRKQFDQAGHLKQRLQTFLNNYGYTIQPDNKRIYVLKKT